MRDDGTSEERWIPVEERLPEEGREVLLWSPPAHGSSGQAVGWKTRAYDGSPWAWSLGDFNVPLGEFPYWRELPKGPA